MSRALIGLFFGVLLLLSYQDSRTVRMEGRIVDDETGQPVAATLLVADADGKALEIEGSHSHVEYLSKRRCYVDGAFALNARPGHLILEARRGLETIPLKTDVDFTGPPSEPLTLRMRRWTNMRERGYLSGDTHVHFLSQAESHLQMRAEDLNILNLLVSDWGDPHS